MTFFSQARRTCGTTHFIRPCTILHATGFGLPPYFEDCGSHLGITINIKNTKFVKDLPMIDAQFRFNQCNSFREEHISVFSPYGPVLIL